MKRLFKAIAATLVIASLFCFLPFERECKSISDDVFRIHILADSDSDRDQELKLVVRDEILNYTDGLYSDVKSKEEAIKITNEHIDEIITVAQDTLKNNNCHKNVSAEICDMDFDTRYYGDLTMPSGNYTALRVIIGSGKGKNWWCVMYPSLCLYTSSDANSLEDELTDNQYNVISDNRKYRFRFKILEYFNTFCNLF